MTDKYIQGVLPFHRDTQVRLGTPYVLTLFVAATLWCIAPPVSARIVAPARTARIGILLPIGPPDYGPLMRRVTVTRRTRIGPFRFVVGTLHGVPVVVCIQPFGGEFTRSLTAQTLLTNFNVRAVLYPGTSGAHLPPSRMLIGDIVLGAKQVNFGNFFMSRTGHIVPDEFQGVSSLGRFDVLYLNPTLLGYLAQAARQVAVTHRLPRWINPGTKHAHPRIFYFGTQGTSSMWLANAPFIEKTDRVFHEIDEDGDWFSGVVAALYHRPFIEVSTISDSIFEFPQTKRGIPQALPKDGTQSRSSAADIAQTISDEVIVDLVKDYGRRLLAQHYATPHGAPFPNRWYQDPTDPHSLLGSPKQKP